MNMSSILPNFRAIVAVCDDWGIGKAGDMLVHNREDMRSFVRHTKGHTVLMGRKNLESFPDAKPLADRRNIVVSRDKSYAPEGVEMAMPGDNVEITAELIHPIAMEQGLKFAIREGGHTVGDGRVTSIIE